MTTSPIISTERLNLRRWKDTDHDTFIALNADPEVMECFPAVMTRDESLAMIKRITDFFETNNFGLYAVELKATGEFLGFTGFNKPMFDSFFTPCIEIAWRLKKEAWGQGYATEAALACLKYGFGTLGFDEICSFTAIINLRSERVMKKLGMQKTGEFDHPKVAPDSPLYRHVLYRITKSEV